MIELIRELDVRNLAIIDHLRVEFASGMTVLTGETGAGKSIIIDALSLLAGGRGSKRYVRTGSKKLILQGLFTFPDQSKVYQLLDRLGINHSDGNVIIQRVIYVSGRNLCRINGMLVNTAILKQVGTNLVEIQKQDAHQVLLDSSNHLTLLDDFDRNQIQSVLQKYHHAYYRYFKIKKVADQRKDHRREWAQHLDMLKFQIHDIQQAHLKPNEYQQLTTQ